MADHPAEDGPLKGLGTLIGWGTAVYVGAVLLAVVYVLLHSKESAFAGMPLALLGLPWVLWLNRFAPPGSMTLANGIALSLEYVAINIAILLSVSYCLRRFDGPDPEL